MSTVEEKTITMIEFLIMREKSNFDYIRQIANIDFSLIIRQTLLFHSKGGQFKNVTQYCIIVILL